MQEELDSKREGYRFSQDDIEIMDMTFSAEEHNLSSEAPYNKIYRKEILENNEYVAVNLDWASSTTSDPHFMMHFGRQNGCDSWGAFSNESCSSIIAKSRRQPFGSLQRGSPILRSFRTKHNCRIDNINAERFDINSYGTISTESQNFHQQKPCKTQDRMVLEQLELCNSKAKSREFETGSYLEELSMMQENLDAMPCTSSIMESNSKTDMETTANSLHAKCKSYQSAPESALNSLNNIFEGTFEPNSVATSEAISKSAKELDSAKEGDESVSSPKLYFQGKEQRKCLIIPHITLHNNFPDKQISGSKPDRIIKRLHNNKKAVKISSSMDKGKVEICEHQCSQRLRTLKHNEKAEHSPKHNKSVDFEFSSTPACNQEDAQFNWTELQINRDKVQQLETQMTKRLLSIERTQELQAPTKHEELASCRGKQLNRMQDTEIGSKQKGHSMGNHLAKSSIMEGTDTNREKLESQRDSPLAQVTNNSHLEYQGMLESYILQLRCMNKALQETVDQGLHTKNCSKE